MSLSDPYVRWRLAVCFLHDAIEYGDREDMQDCYQLANRLYAEYAQKRDAR